MSRINLVSPTDATGDAKAALDQITDYINVALDVPVDFPAVRPRKAA